MAKITTSEAENIATVPKADGRERLCKCLGWAEFDEEKDMQRSIHVDFLYDTLKYTAEKGFSWNKAATCANFADKLVQQIKVEPPFDVNTLKGTKPLNIWEYEQQIAAIERKEQERLDEIMTEKEETVSRINGETKTKLDKVAQSETAFDKEKADGRERLCKCLGWAEFDEEKDMQRSIHEDFLYDTLKYTAEKVEPPFDVNTLKGTKPLNIWEYEQQIAAIERKEQERLDEIMTEKEETVSRINGETKTKLDKVAQSETAFDKEI
ncbi:CH074-like protein [Mya arenaria]|uniref:CH074-like protein n=1 Tax=Mya arenaria TaxID=6604 RepID=A0ABY7FL59_MYAAR|nr:CH074-like protein [Mya arenaria]